MVHTIIRTTIGQHYVNKAVTRGFERANMQPGSVTFIQRFGSALNLNELVVDCVYVSAPWSSLLYRLSHGRGRCGVVLGRSILKERFIQVRLLSVLVRRGYPTAFAPSVPRVAADAPPLRHFLLAPRPSGTQPLRARREREAFASIHDRGRIKHATERGDAPGCIEGSGPFPRGVVLAQVVDPGDEGRGEHRRFVPRARPPDHAGTDRPGLQPHNPWHALAVSW